MVSRVGGREVEDLIQKTVNFLIDVCSNFGRKFVIDPWGKFVDT
jgi:hypothetical protein